MDSDVPMDLVEAKIVFLRGQKVMLSPDLAYLYGVEPRTLIQGVKRNAERFPEDFMFQLTAVQDRCKSGHSRAVSH
jgi:hypothetical protein